MHHQLPLPMCVASLVSIQSKKPKPGVRFRREGREESVARLWKYAQAAFSFFWRKSRNFFFGVSRVFFSMEIFFWCKSRKLFFFWRKSRMGKKTPFFTKKKKRRGNTRTTQQPPLLPEEVKHIAPTDILGTSGTGKAMEPWREGWFLYSSPADGGNNVRQMAEITSSTLIMTANKKLQFALRPLASGIKMTILLPAPPATKL